jgi:hypothetical protein
MHCTSILSSKGDFRVNQLKNKLKDKNSKKFAGSLIIPLYENKWFMLEYLKRLYLIAISKFNNSPMFYMGYGVFLIKEFDNIIAAFYYFNLAEQMGVNLGEKFFVFLAK